MSDIKLTAKDVCVKDDKPVIDIQGQTFDLTDITGKIAQPDSERGFPISVALTAIKLLAAYQEKHQERLNAEKGRREQIQTTLQPIIDQLTARFVPFLAERNAGCCLYLESGKLIIEVDSGIEAPLLHSIKETLGRSVVDFSVSDGAIKPVVDPPRTTKSHKYLLEDGVYKIKDQYRANDVDSNFTFEIYAGKVRLGNDIVKAKDFLDSKTNLPGKHSQGTKEIQKVSERIADLPTQ